MPDTTPNVLDPTTWWHPLARIALFYLAVYIVHRLAPRIAHRAVRLSRFSAPTRRPRPERRATLRDLISSAISFVALATATLLSLGQFVDATTVVWMVGLFSAAFGLGARPLISDFLTGISFIFEDTFAVGEKVEILSVIGVIEAVNLRTTSLRGTTGELYVIPNGEIRMVRNFSRGRFSTANVTISVPAADLARALEVLRGMADEAVALLPNLLEPWQVISESGVMGQKTELTIVAKTRFGAAAELRPRLLTLVQERLAEAGVDLAG